MFSVKLWFILVNHIADPMFFFANPISISLKLNLPISLENDGLHELFLNYFVVVIAKAGNAVSKKIRLVLLFSRHGIIHQQNDDVFVVVNSKTFQDVTKQK